MVGGASAVSERYGEVRCSISMPLTIISCAKVSGHKSPSTFVEKSGQHLIASTYLYWPFQSLFRKQLITRPILGNSKGRTLRPFRAKMKMSQLRQFSPSYYVLGTLTLKYGVFVICTDWTTFSNDHDWGQVWTVKRDDAHRRFYMRARMPWELSLCFNGRCTKYHRTLYYIVRPARFSIEAARVKAEPMQWWKESAHPRANIMLKVLVDRSWPRDTRAGYTHLMFLPCFALLRELLDMSS